jgi:DHA1 family tetracycline resistance protein-like MFS transporter
LKRSLLNHPLINTLFHLKRNARGVVLTEPLWGIPYNLYAPYVSIYMLSLGLHDSQIGLIFSINMGLQVFWSLIGGAITDKLGRKRTTLIFDLITWSVPCLIWAAAQNFTYFVVAAVINSGWRVTHTSWTCTLVEDTQPELLIDVYTWIYIAGLLSAFFAPLAGLFIHAYNLIPTVRGLYILAFFMMTAKFLIMNGMVEETRRGKIRMAETSHQSLFTLLGEYRGVLGKILRTPATLYFIGIWLVTSIFATVNGGFWAVLVTKKLMIPEQNLALFPFVRSLVMLGFFFFITPLLRNLPFRNPMLVGIAGFIVSQLILISAPVGSYPLLVVSIVLEACSAAALNVQVDRMFVLNVDEAERARIMAIVMVIVVGLSAPFGYIAGKLSEIDRVFPFMLNIVLFSIGLVLVWLADRHARENHGVAETIPG